jgi:hypothetical protein
VKYRFANTPASICKSPGIPVFYAALTTGYHGIGGSTGEREAHYMQCLGFCLSGDHDRFKQRRVPHPLAAAYNDVDGAGIRRRFSTDTCSYEYSNVIILEYAALLNRHCSQKPKKPLINTSAGCNELQHLFGFLMAPTNGNGVVYEGCDRADTPGDSGTCSTEFPVDKKSTFIEMVSHATE